MVLFLQFVLGTDTFHLGYTETGHCVGEPNTMLPPPQRLSWDIPEQVYRLEMSGLGLTIRTKGQEHLMWATGKAETPGVVRLEKD